MNGPANCPKYARFIAEDWPHIDKVLDWRDDWKSIEVGSVIEINDGKLTADYKIIKVRNDLLHNYYWLLFIREVIPTNPCAEQPLGKSMWIKHAQWPNLNDIIAVQPMSQPSGLAFYMDFKYGEPGTGKVNKNGDIFPKDVMDKALKEYNDRHLPSKYKP